MAIVHAFPCTVEKLAEEEGEPFVEAFEAALQQHLQFTHAYEVHCPRTDPSVDIVSCTYHHWLKALQQDKASLSAACFW